MYSTRRSNVGGFWLVFDHAKLSRFPRGRLCSFRLASSLAVWKFWKGSGFWVKPRFGRNPSPLFRLQITHRLLPAQPGDPQAGGCALLVLCRGTWNPLPVISSSLLLVWGTSATFPSKSQRLGQPRVHKSTQYPGMPARVAPSRATPSSFKTNLNFSYPCASWETQKQAPVLCFGLETDPLSSGFLPALFWLSVFG